MSLQEPMTTKLPLLQNNQAWLSAAAAYKLANLDKLQPQNDG